MRPVVSHPVVYHPVVYHPVVYHPVVYHPVVYHPGVYHPVVYHPVVYPCHAGNFSTGNNKSKVRGSPASLTSSFEVALFESVCRSVHSNNCAICIAADAVLTANRGGPSLRHCLRILEK